MKVSKKSYTDIINYKRPSPQSPCPNPPLQHIKIAKYFINILYRPAKTWFELKNHSHYSEIKIFGSILLR